MEVGNTAHAPWWGTLWASKLLNPLFGCLGRSHFLQGEEESFYSRVFHCSCSDVSGAHLCSKWIFLKFEFELKDYTPLKQKGNMKMHIPPGGKYFLLPFQNNCSIYQIRAGGWSVVKEKYLWVSRENWVWFDWILGSSSLPYIHKVVNCYTSVSSFTNTSCVGWQQQARGCDQWHFTLHSAHNNLLALAFNSKYFWELRRTKKDYFPCPVGTLHS